MFERVSDSVFFVPNVYGSNFSCVELDDGLVFVDAGMLTSYADEFRRGMETHFRKKASTLVLTHAHIDHFMGMGAFSDCELVAASSAKPRIDTFLGMVFDETRLSRMENIFPYIRQAVDEGKLRSPTRWAESDEYIGEGLRFTVHGGHSACSSGILFEPDGVLFAGDLVQANGYPYFGEPDTDIQSWINALEGWSKADLRLVVPGHGPVVSPDYLRGVSGYFRELVEVLRELKRDGLTAEEACSHPDIPLGYWDRDAVKTPTYDNSIKRLFGNL